VGRMKGGPSCKTRCIAICRRCSALFLSNHSALLDGLGGLNPNHQGLVYVSHVLPHVCDPLPVLQYDTFWWNGELLANT